MLIAGKLKLFSFYRTFLWDNKALIEGWGPD
jgi:hypothetical protein